MIKKRVIFAVFLLFLFAASMVYFTLRPPAPTSERLTLTNTRFSLLAGWEDDSQAAALEAFQHSCRVNLTYPDHRTMGGRLGDREDSLPMAGHVSDWRPACEAALAISNFDDQTARQFFQTWFLPVAISNNGGGLANRGDDIGVFTGYYEPIVQGSLYRQGLYKFPLYSLPKHYVNIDLGEFRKELADHKLVGRVVGNKVKPAETRADIESNGLANSAEVLFWLKDRIDAFFLHIQGSGIVELPDGKLFRVSYAGTNGHPYYAIGRWLIETGAVKAQEMSMQAIRQWLHDNPDMVGQLLNRNTRYIFFKRTKREAAIGAQGSRLVAGRSLAIDKNWVAMGIPLWVSPHESSSASAKYGNTIFPRLMISQDAGSAIRGIVRGDVFFGAGNKAGEHAGVMQMPGRYFALLPRDLILRRTKGDK